MRQIGFAASLALGFLISSCAAPLAARLHLPEPPLPSCLVEEAPQDRQFVGPLQFAPSWIEYARGLEDPRDKTMAAMLCAAETAKSLREAVGTIRLNNRGVR